MSGSSAPIRFATSHGARIGYQIFGDGDETIIAVPPFAQNIEVCWEWPDIAAMLDRLGSFSRYLHFDKRGTGISDRTGRVQGVDERVDDLRALFDDAGIEHAHLFAQSEGGPMSLLFAASYPDRVDSVILLGSGAALFPPDYSDERREQARPLQAAFASRWGTPDSDVVDMFAPSLAVNDEYRTWHQRYERLSATPESIIELFELSMHIDAREALPDITVPVLVLHNTQDPTFPIERGREVAEAVPGAKLVELSGTDHYGYAGDREEWISEVERWVTGSVSEPKPAPRASVEITTLGDFVVKRNGEPVATSDWGSKRARQLCKRLVAARGWPVTRDELTEMLWPDDPDISKLGARLSVQLSTVRRVLGGGIVSDRQSVRLDLSEISTDLETLHSASTDEEVVAAFGGTFLPADLYDDWTAAPRDEATTLFVGAAQRLAEAAVDDDPERAAALARRIVEADRWNESAHALLVTALRAAGQESAARRAHEAWATAMNELGIEIAAFGDLP